MTGRSHHWPDLGPGWRPYHGRNISNQGAAHERDAGVFSQNQASSFKAPMRIIDVVHAPSQPLLGVTLRRLPTALPADIWAVIISHLDYKDLRQARLCSRWMAQEGARHLFRCLNIHFDEADLVRMLCVANTQALAKMVRKLTFEQTVKLPNLSFEQWRDAIQMDGTAKSNVKYMQDLYTEYMRDGRRDQYNNIFECMQMLPYYRMRGSRSPLLPLWPAQTPSNFQRAYVAMDEALLNFVNLEAVELDVKCDDHVSRWRGCKIDTSRNQVTDTSWDNVRPRSTKKLYPGAAETAFILRALGWRNSFTKTLSSLTISFPGEAARYPWRPDHLTELWDQACAAQHGSNNQPPTSLVPLQKDLMADAFLHLKSLEINIGCYDLTSLPDAKATAVLSGFLHAARGLESVSITLGSDHSISYLEYFIYERQAWAAPRRAYHAGRSPAAAQADILASLVGGGGGGVHWPALKDVMLVGVKTTAATLLSLLASVAPTLESLHLEFCMLVGDSDSDDGSGEVVVDTWPRVYERMRALRFPRLADLLFHECVDFDPQRRFRAALDPELEEELLPPTYPAFPPAVLQYSILGGGGGRPYEDFDDDRPVAGSFVKVWPESLYDYILRKMDYMPPCYVRWERRSPTDEEIPDGDED